MDLSLVTMRSIFALIISILIISCSSSEISQPEKTNDPDEIVLSKIIKSKKIHKIDDLISAGWKKNKQFDNSEFPETDGIWYGFFQKRDIEVWIYDSHENAEKFGVPYAEEAIQKRPGQTDYMIPRVNRYHAYVIFGNMLLLCEDQVSDCQKLVDQLL